MSEVPGFNPETPQEIIDRFATQDDPEAQVIQEMYRSGWEDLSHPELQAYTAILKKYPDHAAYMDALRSKEVRIQREAETFKATTFEQAMQIPNHFDAEKTKLLLDSYRKNGGQINLSYDFYLDNEYEQPYSNSEKLREAYYQDLKSLRSKYKQAGFSCSDNSLVFAEYTSPKAMQNIENGTFNYPSKRIYLNPHPAAAKQVFEEVMEAIVEEDLSVQIKVSEASMVAGDFATKHRDDRIVLYSDDEQADKALSVIQRIYQAHADDFVNSKVPFVTTELAPGMGVAAEKSIKDRNGEKYSASKYREALLGRFMASVPEHIKERILSGNLDDDFYEKLANILNKYLGKTVINTQNWSFYN